MKKKILFIADKPNWAYEFMVQSWMPFLNQDYDCYIAYQQDYFIKKNNNKYLFKFYLYNIINRLRFLLYKILKKQKRINFISKNRRYFFPKYTFNKVYQISGSAGKIVSDQMKFDIQIEMAYYFQYTAELPFDSKRKIVGIFTDTFPHEGPEIDIKTNVIRTSLSREDFYLKYLKSYDYIIVGGGNLYPEYRKLTDRVSFVYGILGQENFIENNNVGRNDHLTIGWTGTPDRPMKGFRTIIEPAIEKVRKTGRDIRLKTKFSGPYEELYSFYKDVDLIVIASSADSGPSLFAEASLSNVPTISTKVGLPLMGIEHDINGLFIERNLESLEKAILELYDNREKLQSFSKRIKQDYIEKLGNEKSVQNILKLINNFR